MGRILTIVDATFKYILLWTLVTEATFMLSPKNMTQHGKTFISFHSFARGSQPSTEVAPSTPVPHEGETPSIPETLRFDPGQGDPSPEEPAIGVAIRLEASLGIWVW